MIERIENDDALLNKKLHKKIEKKNGKKLYWFKLNICTPHDNQYVPLTQSVTRQTLDPLTTIILSLRWFESQ